MEFFVNPNDLKNWVKSKTSADEAATQILSVIGNNEQTDVLQTCRAICGQNEKNSQDASKILFEVLAKHNITKLQKEANMNNIKKEAQNKQVSTTSPESRQRNNWVRGNRNKWNRVVDGFNEGTPWRIDRDKFFNFTHYYTDAISFDEDPNRVYSGEAIWRMYIMDKFTSDYQNKEGKLVGGYINDRFYVFPDAGTPANQKVARDGGNQLELPAGIKTRKPRPHQYSTERRLEEARNEDTYDLEAFTADSNKIVKLAKKAIDNKDDKIYAIFKDTLDMREAGIDYEVMLDAVSKHYEATIDGVAQIDKLAQEIKKKHSGIIYDLNKTAAIQLQKSGNYVVVNPVNTVNGKVLPKDTDLVYTGVPNQFQVSYSPDGSLNEGAIVVLSNFNDGDIIPSGSDVGLVNDTTAQVNMDEYPDHTFQGPAPTKPVQPQPAENFPMAELDNSGKTAQLNDLA